MCAMVFGILGAVVSAAGSIMSAQAQANAANAQAAAYEAQAQLQQRQARAEMMAGQREAAKKSRELDVITAKQRLSYSTAGVLIDGGSPVDVAVDTAREGALDVAAIQWNAEVKSGNYNYQAQISQMNAQNQRNAAETAQTMGYIGALSPLINAGGRIASGSTGTSLGFSFGA